MRIPLAFFGTEQAGPTWASRYRMEWAQVVGRRVRSLRLQREMTISELAQEIERAPGELLGSEGVERPLSDAELTMVRVARNLLLSPEQAIVRLMAGGPDPRGSDPRDGDA